MRVRQGYRKRPKFLEPAPPSPPWFTRYLYSISQTLHDYWIPVLVFLVPLIVYWPVLQVGFVSDDFFYHSTFNWNFGDFIEKIGQIRTGEIQFPFFRPIVLASFSLDYFIWGEDATGFHLTNLVLHSLNAVLLFYLARILGLRKFGAAAGALFFGLYPAHPEAVTWISGRFDVLGMTFFMAALLAWCASRLRSDIRWMIPSFLLFLLALGCKEHVAVGILILPLIDWILHTRTRREWGTGVGWNWKWYIIFFALVVVFLGIRMWLFGNLGGYFSEHDTAFFSLKASDIRDRLVKGDFLVLITPVSRILWPGWSIVWRTAISAAGAVLGVILIGSLVYSILEFRKNDETQLARIISGIAWIVLLLLPVAIIDGAKTSLDFTRFLYLPVAGLAMWVGTAADFTHHLEITWRRISAIVLVLVLVVSGGLLWKHNTTWLEAGHIARRIHAAMSPHTTDLSSGSTIFAVNFPYMWKGAHCAPIKYEGYVEFAYGITGVNTSIERMDPDEIDNWWDNIGSEWETQGIGFVWDPAGEELIVLPGFKGVLSEEILDEMLGPETPVPGHEGEITELDVLPEPIE